MGTALALAAYAVLLGLVATAVWRRPLIALYLFVVGLALHNAVMAGLFGLGLRGGALTVVQAWKEVLLAVAAARIGLDSLRERKLPFRPGPIDALALAYAAAVVLYGLIPQGLLDGHAGAEARLLAVRNDLAPAGAFLVGRSIALSRDQLRTLGWTLAAAASAVGAVGLVEVYAVPIDWWRDSSVPAYFRDQLGYEYHGTGGLPENFIYNTGSEDHFLRRAVSTFLSPLGTAFMLVVGLLFAAAAWPLARWKRLLAGLSAVSAAGLLFTFSRSSLLVLAGGLVVLAVTRRWLWPLAAALATVAVAVAFAEVFPSIAPRGDWTQADLAVQRQRAAREGGVEGGPLSTGEPSIESHLASLRDGLRNVAEHPQGYGPGNAGTVAARTDVPLQAGESTYTELGVETGLLGLLAFVVWNVALLASLFTTARRAEDPTIRWAAAGATASLAAVLALGIQTATLAVPWLAYCVWWLGGSLGAPALARESRRTTSQAASLAQSS